MIYQVFHDLPGSLLEGNQHQMTEHLTTRAVTRKIFITCDILKMGVPWLRQMSVVSSKIQALFFFLPSLPFLENRLFMITSWLSGPQTSSLREKSLCYINSLLSQLRKKTFPELTSRLSLTAHRPELGLMSIPSLRKGKEKKSYNVSIRLVIIYPLGLRWDLPSLGTRQPSGNQEDLSQYKAGT